MTPMWVILDLKYMLRLRTTEQNDPYVGHFVPPYAYFTITREEITDKMTPCGSFWRENTR